VLWEERRLSVSGLGERLRLDSGTLTPLLKRLADKGFILRERDTQDERQVNVSLTPQGEELKEKAIHIPHQISRCVNLDMGEAVTLYRLLYKVLAAPECEPGT
jgi:DNA-binding MarR family transcriptional regulator